MSTQMMRDAHLAKPARESQPNYSRDFAFLRPRALFFRALFPHLAAAFDQGCLQESVAISRAQMILERCTRSKLRSHAPHLENSASIVTLKLLTRLAERGLGNSFDQNRGNGWTLLYGVLANIIKEVRREEERTLLITGKEPAVEACQSKELDPFQCACENDLIDLARKHFRKLSVQQQWAVSKVYPFLGTGPENEHVDRHRGLKALAEAVRYAAS